MNAPKVHPAAELFPMLTEPELEELAADIRARGLLHPVVMHEGAILDGRNRWEACRRAEVPAATVEWHSLPGVAAGDSPVGWVLSTNLHRRHLNESQRGVIAAKALPLLEAEASARQKAALKRGTQPPVSAPGREREDAPAPTPPGKKGKSSELAAKAVGASARSVERAKAVLTTRPDLVEQIMSAKLTLKRADKIIRQERELKHVLEYRPPVGTYAVIVADVPWQYDDQLDGSDQVRGGTGYPTMSLDEIVKIKPPAAPDCALWFWVTNAFLMDGSAAQVLSAWGFEPKALLTWRKVDKAGKDRLGAGHYLRNVTEHCILAVKGKPVVQGGDMPNIFDAPRTARHSQKPDRFFEIAEKVTPCPPAARIELFAIDERKGWVTSGSEQQAKARAKRPDAREPVLETKTHEGASLIWREGSGDVLKAAGASGVMYTIKPSSKAPGFVELADTDSNTTHVPNRLLAKQRADQWEQAALAEAEEEKAKKAADAEAAGRGAPRNVGSHAPKRAKQIVEAHRAKQRKALKTKTPGVTYTCSFCDLVAEKWAGKCPGCGNWGTLNETAEAGSGAPGLSIEWAEPKKKHPVIVDVGRGGGFRFNIERTRNQKLKKTGGYIWRRWPERGKEGRTTSIPEVYESAADARAAALLDASKAKAGAA